MPSHREFKADKTSPFTETKCAEIDYHYFSWIHNIYSLAHFLLEIAWKKLYIVYKVNIWS